MQLAGKVALVTGAGSGIGKSAALLLAAQGAKVAALSRTEKEIQHTAQEIRQAGGDAIAINADVSSEKHMLEAVAQLVDRWGRLDIVFANAGINGVWAPLEELSLDDWNTTLNINLTGTFLTIKSALPHLKKQGGSIVVCSSVNGTRVFSNTGATAYSCTKAAQVAMTKMLALELAPYRIRVNVVCPGWIDTQIGDNMEVRGYRDPHRRHPGAVERQPARPARAGRGAGVVPGLGRLRPPLRNRGVDRRRGIAAARLLTPERKSAGSVEPALLYWLSRLGGSVSGLLWQEAL